MYDSERHGKNEPAFLTLSPGMRNICARVAFNKTFNKTGRFRAVSCRSQPVKKKKKAVQIRDNTTLGKDHPNILKKNSQQAPSVGLITNTQHFLNKTTEAIISCRATAY